MSTMNATSVNIKSALSSESSMISNVVGSSLVELELPFGSNSLIQNIENDEIIHQAIQGRFKSYILIIRANQQSSKFDMYSYVSKVYSKLWDEAVQCSLFSADFIVLNDSDMDVFVAALDQCGKQSELSTVFYYREELRNTIETLREATSSRNALTYKNNNEICDGIRKCFLEQERIFSFDVEDNSNDDITFPHVALGGTFDRLHNGHRKLLTLAAAITSNKMTIGITGTSMLTKKSGAHLITSFEDRCQGVNSFMKMIKPHLECNIVALEDSFGPTITDPNIDAIVVSSETIRGAFQINQIRREKQLKPLAVGVSLRSDAAVLSSSFLRDKLVAQK